MPLWICTKESRGCSYEVVFEVCVLSHGEMSSSFPFHATEERTIKGKVFWADDSQGPGGRGVIVVFVVVVVVFVEKYG